MRTKLLMITLAMLSIFTAQQAIAKSSTKTSAKTSATSKKHHNKHAKSPIDRQLLGADLVRTDEANETLGVVDWKWALAECPPFRAQSL